MKQCVVCRLPFFPGNRRITCPTHECRRRRRVTRGGGIPGPPTCLRPGRKGAPEGAGRAGFFQHAGPEGCQRFVPQGCPRPDCQLDEHGAHCVFARRLAGLDVRVHAAISALRAAVQQIPQCQQGGGLARLARAVQNEILLVPDELEDLVEIQPFQGRDAVVVRRNHGAGGVEDPHGRSMAGPMSRGRLYRPSGSRPPSRRGGRGRRRAPRSQPRARACRAMTSRP